MTTPQVVSDGSLSWLLLSVIESGKKDDACELTGGGSSG